jgi:hypothetical protein
MRQYLGPLVLFVAVTWPALSEAESGAVICADDQLSVVAPTPELASFACDVALDAKTRIVACGLDQHRPIRIELIERLEHPAAECLAAYSCSDDVIRVTDPAAIPGALDPSSPYTRLPPDIVFAALVVHEMAHALLAQSSDGREIAFVDHEYVAAALELDSLAPEWRAVLIEAAPIAHEPTLGLISPLIYALEPRAFAANAWAFFDAEDDGCDRVGAIARGEFTFSSLPR